MIFATRAASGCRIRRRVGSASASISVGLGAWRRGRRGPQRRPGGRPWRRSRRQHGSRRTGARGRRRPRSRGWLGGRTRCLDERQRRACGRRRAPVACARVTLRNVLDGPPPPPIGLTAIATRPRADSPMSTAPESRRSAASGDGAAFALRPERRRGHRRRPRRLHSPRVSWPPRRLAWAWPHQAPRSDRPPRRPSARRPARPRPPADPSSRPLTASEDVHADRLIEDGAETRRVALPGRAAATDEREREPEEPDDHDGGDERSVCVQFSDPRWAAQGSGAPRRGAMLPLVVETAHSGDRPSGGLPSRPVRARRTPPRARRADRSRRGSAGTGRARRR